MPFSYVFPEKQRTPRGNAIIDGMPPDDFFASDVQKDWLNAEMVHTMATSMDASTTPNSQPLLFWIASPTPPTVF